MLQQKQSSQSSVIDFSLVIACYCEEPHLLSNVKILAEYFCHTILKVEFIFVEDCSPDKTKDQVIRCCEWLQSSTTLSHQVIFHEKNTGRGRAVQDGMLLAKGFCVGFIDIDLENPHDALLPIILRLQHGEADGIIANRLVELAQVSWLRMILSGCYKFLVHLLLPLPVKDSEAGLKVFRRDKILQVLPLLKNQKWFWDTEICFQAFKHGLIIKNHDIVFVKNKNKKSTVKVFRDSIEYLIALLKVRLKSN